MKTRVKIAVQMKGKDIPGWPCINYDYDKELARVTAPIFAKNPDIEFDIFKYTNLDMAKADYEEDLKKYDGVLVLLMTNWLKIDRFYIEQSKTGLPVIVADVPFCGSGTMLSQTSSIIREGKYPVAMISSLDYNDIADAVRIFSVLKKIKDSKILVVKNKVQNEDEKAASEIWGCTFINKTAADLMEIFNTIPDEEALPLAKKWTNEATGVLEPSDADILQSAKLYYAIKKLVKECGADAVTIDCLELSYNDIYGNNRHMYPCLSHYQMANDGELGVCEADINSTISSMITLYLTGRPGFVSDPVIDTSSKEIIYSHCVACKKVFGKDDPRTCQYYLRSHAEDKKGASVQVIFPAGEKLTTIQMSNTERWASIHSSESAGNAGGDNGCRSKLVAKCEADNILKNWMPQWHRITVFGDYRRSLENIFIMKSFNIVAEDK
ncbi:MAG: hypothetical protein ACI4QR_05680 [Eubacteriales bacterium]